jgi:hypothetical protein
MFRVSAATFSAVVFSDYILPDVDKSIVKKSGYDIKFILKFYLLYSSTTFWNRFWRKDTKISVTVL